MSPIGRQIKGENEMDKAQQLHFNDYWFKTTYVEMLDSLNDDESSISNSFDLSTQMQSILDDEVYYAKRQDTFGVYLQKLIDKRNLSDPQVYKQANISRQQFSEIKNGLKNGKKYYPNKIDIFRIAIVLEVTLEELNELLKRADCNLVRSDITDAIITFFIQNQIYDFSEIDEQLVKYNQFPLSKVVD